MEVLHADVHTWQPDAGNMHSPSHLKHIIKRHSLTLSVILQIYYSYVKQRREFGKHAAFTAQEADVRFAKHTSCLTAASVWAHSRFEGPNY